MELRHLRYFTAVVQWKGYREASRHLYITQPSISEAVSDLESELGIKLFSRDSSVSRLTPEGQVFYEEAIRRSRRRSDPLQLPSVLLGEK
jgi:DNA-binding transcriptional LysR family regulator